MRQGAELPGDRDGWPAGTVRGGRRLHLALTVTGGGPVPQLFSRPAPAASGGWPAVGLRWARYERDGVVHAGTVTARAASFPLGWLAAIPALTWGIGELRRRGRIRGTVR